ncbi:MAG TPA: hypothetical protein VFA32_13390, partial [Dehalococcoidia bacterium]|nr:hypothetical protein [Dehalococcoidia bacterium]
HARYHGAFHPETHTPESFLAAIEEGKAFCAELLTVDCGREHHGQKWCCKKRREQGDPTHCGRPHGYRISWHFASSQVLALDVDAGNLTIQDLLADLFISQYASFIYPTISWSPEQRKWRVVFILTEAITDAQVYRKAATALLDRYDTTDQQVKDPARLFFGMKPGNGEAVFQGNLLPMGEVLKLVSEYEDRRRQLEREVNYRQLPPVDSSQLSGNTPDERYVRRAIAEELAYLASRPAGTGERYPSVIPTAMRLESLRLSGWLAPEARAQVDVAAIVLEGATQNGSLALYGEAHLSKAIGWGIAHAEPRPMPTDWGQHQHRSESSVGNEDRTIVQVNNRFMREITSDATSALVKVNHPPRIFCRGSALVRLSEDNGGLSAEPLIPPALKGELDRAADFVKVGTKKEGGELVQVQTPSRVPDDVVRDILAQQRLPFQVLNGFASTPVFLPDGTLLASEGYDTASGIYLRLDGLEGLRWDMSLDRARALLLDEMLVDFPFIDDASQAHALALLLQRFLRFLIPGATPLYLIDAPTRGTGKGLLADVIAVVATGGPSYVMSLPRDDDELEKRITAALLAGRQLIQLDNVRQLRSAPLEAALTTTLWEGRRLGRSEIVRAPNTATWLATGNNVELSDEMNRRAVLIRLDAGVEAPEDRAGFQHPLPGWAMEHRSELVSACLSIITHWVEAGMPRGQATLGRYEGWAGVMGGVLGVSGVLGLLANREQQKERDQESQEWVALCRAWWEQYQSLPATGKDVLEVAKQEGILMDYWAGRRDLSAQQRMGHALSRRRDRVFGEYRVRAASTGATGNNAYRLEPVRVGYKTPKTPETPPASYKSSGGTGGVLDGGSPKTPSGETRFVEHPDQNTPAEPDTKSGVSGVSGVFVGSQSPDGNDVLEVE